MMAIPCFSILINIVFYIVSSQTNLSCTTPQACYDLANTLQIQGTQESFVESTIVLYNSLNEWKTDASLWSLYGKLNLFYILNWHIAKQSINNSLVLDSSVNNLNTFIFNGWLYSTPVYRDVDTARKYFLKAIELNGNNTANFWPYFEYAVFLSHIADEFELSNEFFEIAYNAAPTNSFINFFYGLLLEYHLNQPIKGEDMIEIAIEYADELPGQGASNVAFQGQLLFSRNRDDEYTRCCQFAENILNKDDTIAGLFCF